MRPPAPARIADFLGADRLVRLQDMPASAQPRPPPTKPKAGGKKANVAAAPKPAAPGSGRGKAGAAAAGAAGAAAAGPTFHEYPESSLAEARQAVVASCILPLGAHPALAK